jgi:hypothetical protein
MKMEEMEVIICKEKKNMKGGGVDKGIKKEKEE